MLEAMALRERSRVLPRLQRSPRVAEVIPRHLRALDLTIVVLTAPITLLMGAVLALAVLIDSPGPLLYRARRVGRGGREFGMLKFRTMRHGVVGPSLTAKGDVRHTHLGRSLSSSRLDELPQLLNVLRGDMRLVGPRPEVREFVEAFPDEYEVILSVPPGLTGPAQLAFASEGRILASVEDRAEYYRTHLLPLKVAIDVSYAREHNARRDLSILALTPLLPLAQVARGLLHGLDTGEGASRARVAVRALPALLLVLGVVVLMALVLVETTGPI